MEDLEFKTGDASLATLRTMTEEVWAALQSPEGRAEVKAAGFDPELVNGEPPYAFRPVQAGSPGVPETVAIALVAAHTLAPVAKTMLLDIWRGVVLPRIKRRFGADAIGDPIAPKAAKGPEKAGKTKGKSPAKAKTPKTKRSD
ncbi:MAG TPA: hypothetical protein VF495_00235 [Phenylobacterium sp.]